MTVSRTRTYRGLSVRAAVGYLERLGGERTGDRAVEGDRWRATLTGGRVEISPSLTVKELTVEFEGDAETLDDLVEAFSQKAVRAGG